MKAFFTDIFNYHHHFNQKLIGQLIEYEKRLPERTIPLFCQTHDTHQIWNARILKKASLGIHQNHPLDVCKRLDHENYQETINEKDDQ